MNIITEDMLRHMSSEYPIYKSLSMEISIHNDAELLSSFWIRHASKLPSWFELFKIISLIQPSSACVERALSTFRSVCENKERALEETLECSVILRYNSH